MSELLQPQRTTLNDELEPCPGAEVCDNCPAQCECVNASKDYMETCCYCANVMGKVIIVGLGVVLIFIMCIYMCWCLDRQFRRKKKASKAQRRKRLQEAREERAGGAPRSHRIGATVARDPRQQLANQDPPQSDEDERLPDDGFVVVVDVESHPISQIFLFDDSAVQHSSTSPPPPYSQVCSPSHSKGVDQDSEAQDSGLALLAVSVDNAAQEARTPPPPYVEAVPDTT